jgi:hypothetical protein
VHSLVLIHSRCYKATRAKNPHPPPEPACSYMYPPASAVTATRTHTLSPEATLQQGHYSCSAREEPRVCTAASSFRAEWLQPVARSTDCRTLMTCYLPRRAPINGLRNSRGLGSATISSGWARSNRSLLTQTHSSSAIPRFGCSLPPCVSFHC